MYIICIEKHTNINPPINKYVVLSRSSFFTFSIITTNINNTAIAPTYTIKKTRPINSACRNINISEELAKTSIKKTTEWIGFMHDTIIITANICTAYNAYNKKLIIFSICSVHHSKNKTKNVP